LDGEAFRLLQTTLNVTIDPNERDPVAPGSATNSSGTTLIYRESGDVGLQVPALNFAGLATTNYAGSIGLSLTPQTLVEGNSSYSYVLPGMWLISTSSTATFSAFVMGLQTAFAGVPSSGLASYSGDSVGVLFTPDNSSALWGLANLTANFSTGVVSGGVTNVGAFNGNAGGTSNDVELSANMLAGSSSFRGTTKAGPPGNGPSLSATATGTIEGGFFGPNAEELGAVWTLSDGTNAAIGTIGAASSPATIGIPSAPSLGSSPAPTQTASNSGPVFDASGPLLPNATFPLISTSLDYTAKGLAAVPNTQSATAIVKTLSAVHSEIQLVIPALDLDTTISIPAPLAGNRYIYDPAGSYGKLGGLSYVSFGMWAQAGGAFYRPSSMSAYAFGYETPVGAMPTTGTAEYAGMGTATGFVFFPFAGQVGWREVNGNAQLTANFTTGNVSGVLALRTDDWDFGVLPWHDVSVNATIAAGSNRFNGTTGIAASYPSDHGLNSSATGSINGAFYGPAAENLGAVWTLSDGTRSAIGVVGAERQ